MNSFAACDVFGQNEFGAVGISRVQSCNVKMVHNVISLGDICALNEGLLFTVDFHSNSPLILTVVMYCSVIICFVVSFMKMMAASSKCAVIFIDNRSCAPARHNRSTGEEDQVASSRSFDWLRQMRFYFDPKHADVLQQLSIHMANDKFNYGFEYLGVQEKLVQTPLTEQTDAI